MIVYISDKNRVTDLLFNTQQFITTNNLDDINKDVISALIKSSFGEDSSYEIQIDNTIKGQYIIIETETIKKYIMFSYEQPDGTRNGYILTKTPVPFRAFLLDDTIKNK